MAPDRCSVWLDEDIRIRRRSGPRSGAPVTGPTRPEMFADQVGNADRAGTGGKPVVAPRKGEQSWLSLKAGRRCRPCCMTWMTARTRDRGLASGRIAVMINDWIEDRFTLPKPDLPSLTGHAPEPATQELRARWGLGEKPIGNLIHLLEAHGVRIYSLTHENTDLDAFSLYWHGQPFMFLGTEKSAERSRFDAAHELAHLVLHGEEREPYGAAAEREANQFAAAFLMPRSGVLAQRLRNAPAERILVAKRRWNVAAMALAHRTNELGLMTEWCYRSVCINLSRMGYRRGEPAGMGARESSQLLTKVLQQLRTAGSGVHEIAGDLGLQPSEVQAHMFGLTPIVLTGGDSSGGSTPSRPGLHIVRGGT